MLMRLARGEGVILDGDLRPFHDAMVRPADPGEVSAWLERVRPNRSALEIGELLLTPGVAAALDSGGSTGIPSCAVSRDPARPTPRDWCSSGSCSDESAYGHSRSQLRLHPFVRGPGGADPAVAAEYAAAASGVSVWQNDPGAAHPLQLQFLDLDPRHKPPSSASIQSTIEKSTPRCQKFLLPAKGRCDQRPRCDVVIGESRYTSAGHAGCQSRCSQLGHLESGPRPVAGR